MPNLDVNIDEILTTYCNRLLSNDNWYYVDGGSDTYPLKEVRVTTNRNSKKVTLKKIKSCLPPPSYEWYRKKPIISEPEKAGFGPSFGVKPFKERLKDWRSSKQLEIQAEIFRRRESARKIPTGYHIQNVKTGKYVLDEFTWGKAKNIRYGWVPETVPRLRSNRPWTRHNPKQPINALVNDLYYYKQTSLHRCEIDLQWSDTGGFSSVVGSNMGIDGSKIDLINYGRYCGISSVPDLTTSVDPVTILANWQPVIDSLSNLALKRHYSKLKNQKVDLATELSQGMLTIRMIGDIAKRIGGSLLALKKGNLVQASKLLSPTTLKAFANDYLMWQYGIKPLIGDLKGAAEHLAEYIMRAAPVKSNGHAKKVNHQFYSTSLGGGWVRNVTIDTEIRVKFGTSFCIDDSLTRQASQLGFTNPAAVIWELIPFSFVADWFIPIGEWMGNLSALTGLSIKESYKTVFIKQTCSEVLIGIPSSTVKTWLDDHGVTCYSRCMPGGSVYQERSTEVIYCKRYVLPLPKVPKPEFKNPVSPQHIKNALALFTQLVSK